MTVVGVPGQSPEAGRVCIDEGPADGLLGTHAGDDGPPEPLVLAGDLDTAATRIHRRVVWLGVGGLVLALGGQALAAWLAGGYMFSPW